MVNFKLYRTLLGVSARDKFCDELTNLPQGKGALVLPNNNLFAAVRKKHPHFAAEMLSMDAVAARILNLNGYTKFEQINRRSQELVIQEQLKDLCELGKLPYFAKLVDKPGFVKAMTSLVGQFSRSGATKEEINYALNHWERQGKLGEKDSEIALLYAYYRIYLKEKKWFDLEGKFRLALLILENSASKMPWEELYFCDFYTFDALQQKFIEALSKRCAVHVGFCYETHLAGTEREKYFAAGKKTWEFLENLALQDKGVEVYAPKEQLSAGCEQVRQKLGLVSAQAQPIHASQDVQIYSFTDREKEMRYVLTRVKQLLLDGVPASDILITMRDLSLYPGLRILADEYGLPLALSECSNLLVQPLTQFLLLLLRSASEGHYAAESYIELLASPAAHLLLGIDGEVVHTWREEQYFTLRSKVQEKLQAKLDAGEWEQDAVLDLINQYIEKLAQSSAQGSVQVFSELMLNFLQDLGLEKRWGALYKQGKISLPELQAQLATKTKLVQVCQALQEDYTACGRVQEALELTAWQKLLTDSLLSEEIVLEKQRRDGVPVYEAASVQGLEFPYVFLMGLREGEFSQVKNENWIYNDNERTDLQGLGIEIPNTFDAYAEDACFFATTVASASKQLIATYFVDDAAVESAYVGALRKLFCDCTKIDDGGNPVQLQVTVKPAKEPASLAEFVQEHHEAWPYAKDEDTQEYIFTEEDRAACDPALVDRERVMDNPVVIFEEEGLLDAGSSDREILTIAASFNGILSETELLAAVQKRVGSAFSASALEIYAKCPFAYLGQRVWRQNGDEALDGTVTPKDQGDLLHACLAQFLGKHLGVKLTTHTLAELEQELQGVFTWVIDDAVQKGKLHNSPVWEIEKERLYKMLLNWLHYEYEEQQGWTGFTPQEVEWDFGSKAQRPVKLALQDGTRVDLQGRIDRLDGDAKKIFVTDYKRSDSSVPTFAALENGLNMQLPMYLLAVEQCFSEQKHPAGGGYYSLQGAQRKNSLVLEELGNNLLEYKPKKNPKPGEPVTWNDWKVLFVGFLQKYIAGIYAGKFPIKARKNCATYCPLKDICRRKLFDVGTVEEE